MSKIQQGVQLNYYDKNTGDYESGGIVFTRGLNRASYRKASLVAGGAGAGSPSVSILELGAGTGLVTYYLTQKLKFAQYTALDLSAEMLAIARDRIKTPGVNFVCGDVGATGLESKAFDLVVGIDFIHHIEDPVAVLKELRRVAKPGARLSILETNARNPMVWRNVGVEHEVRIFLNTPANLSRWAAEAGWQDVAVRPVAAFTPSGPKFIGPLLSLFDQVSSYIPVWKNCSAQLLLTAKNSD